MSIIQGGFGFPVLTPPVYKYIVSSDINVAVLSEDIPNPAISHIVSLVSKFRIWYNVLRMVFYADRSCHFWPTVKRNLFWWICIQCSPGYKKSGLDLTVNDKFEVTNILAAYHTLVKVKAEMDQFTSGLQCINGLLPMLKSHPSAMKTLFVADKDRKVLTAGKFMI